MIETATGPWPSAPERVSRPAVICALYLLGVVNGFAGSVTTTIASAGFWHALLMTFNVSVLQVAATVVGAHRALRSPALPLSRADHVAIALYLALLFVPHSAVSWAALSAFALYDAIRAGTSRSRLSANAIAAATIFIAIAASALWGKVLVQLFAGPLLSIDGALAAWVVQSLGAGEIARTGNAIVSGDHTLIVMPGCSSVHGISFGLLCWITIARARRPEWRLRDLPMALLICCAMVLLNVVRLGLMALSHHNYLIVHGPLGENATSIAVIALAAALALHAAGRESSRPGAVAGDTAGGE